MTKSLDRWLREMLHERPDAEPSGAVGTQGRADNNCLDAETVAGWFDDTLTARDRTVAQAHLADCARCQAVLAAMARTAPVPLGQPFWRPIYSRLLIPLGVAATGVLILVSLPQTPEPRQESLNARAEIKPEGIVPEEVAPRPSGRAVRGAPVVPAQVLGDRATSAKSAERRELPPEGAAQANNANAPAVPVAAAAPGAAVPPSVAAPAPVEETTQQAAPAALAETVTVTGSAAAAPPPQRPAPTVEQMRTALRSAAASGLEVVSSDASTRWRLAAAGVVQRSTDGGVTWESRSTGIPFRPTAGASPSPSVCWLVGPGGIVLLTTDGRSWRRIPFTEQVDLIAITATDDMTATVITADGRTFLTVNRGGSWERQPPVR
jgi:hypothetical protein